VVTSEQDFHQLEKNIVSAIASDALHRVTEQLHVSIASTKALAALINIDGGAQLMYPNANLVDELIHATATFESTQVKESKRLAIVNASASFNFNRVAKSLTETFKGISNIQLAPSGVVSVIHPISGNEKAIGLDFFFDPSETEGTNIAIEKESVTVYGPITLVQNGKRAVVARFPVLMDDDSSFVGKSIRYPKWWGFTTMLSEVDTMLNIANIHSLRDAGLLYVLYVTDSTGGTQQLIGHAEGVHYSEWEDWIANEENIEVSVEDDTMSIYWRLAVRKGERGPTHSPTFGVQIIMMLACAISGIVSLYLVLVRESALAFIEKSLRTRRSAVAPAPNK